MARSITLPVTLASVKDTNAACDDQFGSNGASMVRRLWQQGHVCVVHDRQAAEVARLRTDGAASAAELVTTLARPRAIWLMLPAYVQSAALYQRFASRGDAGFANRVLSATRHAFGGHAEQPTGDSA